MEEFDKKFPELYSSNDGREGYDCEVSFDLKSHLLQSQIKLIEAVIEKLRKPMWFIRETPDEYMKGYTKALEDQISSLNETLEFLKKSL